MKKALIVIFLMLSSVQAFAECYSAFYSDYGVTAAFITTPKKADCRIIDSVEYYDVEFTRNLLGLDMKIQDAGYETILRPDYDVENGNYGLMYGTSIPMINDFIKARIDHAESQGRKVIRVTL